MKLDIGIWFRKSTGKGGTTSNRDIVIFGFFLLLSFIFWYLNALGKDIEYTVKYPVRYINIPEDRVLSQIMPVRVDLNLKGPGYSVLKLKLTGNSKPAVLDFSTINYRRVPGSKMLNYFIPTSGLIPKLKNQLRTECSITSIKPDTLFFSFDKIISKKVSVIADIEVQTEKQYLIKGKIISEPDSIIVSGPKRIIDTIESVKTRYRKFKGIDESLKHTIQLKTTRQYSVSQKKVLITIPVEQFTEAEFQAPVRIVNNNDSVDIRIFPAVVTVKCLVAVSDYVKIKNQPFDAIADLSKIDLNSSDKIPVGILNAPQFISSLRIIPANVDFLIEKRPR